MTTLALELHDAGLLTVDESGAIGPVSPGYALWDGGDVVTGQAALGRAREAPRFAHHRFWQDLDTEPLGRPFPSDLSPADLAHAHLSEIHRSLPDGVRQLLLAVPGCFSARQLGLILGIARACRLPVAGMVDAAVAATPVAAAAAGHPGHRFLHLDLHLHRAVLTELAMSTPPGGAQERQATVVRRRVKVDAEVGLVALQDAWARRIAELFVHATRFDPLHAAASEQILYNRMPRWLDAMRSRELIEVSLGPAGQERTIELTRPDMVSAADACYDRLRELALSLMRTGESITLLLAPGVAELPGLARRLDGLRGVTTVPLPAGAAAAGALLVRDQIRAAGAPAAGASDPASSLPFVTRISFEAPPEQWPPEEPAAAAVLEPAPRRPTHLVHDGLAYPLTGGSFHLGRALGGAHGLELERLAGGVSRQHCTLVQRGGELVVEDHSTHGSFVNGERVDGQATLEIGDRLRLGDVELLLIAVAKMDGSS